MIHGYDISGYQSSSWTTKTGMLFVKATEGSTFVNSRFVSQYSGAKKYATIYGAYHFARPGGSSAFSQADHFVATIKPHLTSKSLLVLDLEVSKLNQAGTNQFAKDFARRLRSKLPGHRLVLYMGGGYSSTNTGAGLSEFFDLWWYPRYPSTRNTTSWPSSFSPSAPVGRTGWKRPDIWQWTDNWGSSHLDANISDRTADYLLGAKISPTSEDDDVWEYVSLAAKLTASSAQSQRVSWTTEWADTGDAHADTKSGKSYPGILSGGDHGAQFTLTVNVPDDLEWRFIETDPAKNYETSKTYPTRKGSFTESGWCSAKQHLYLELLPTSMSAGSLAVKGHWRHR